MRDGSLGHHGCLEHVLKTPTSAMRVRLSPQSSMGHDNTASIWTCLWHLHWCYTFLEHTIQCLLLFSICSVSHPPYLHLLSPTAKFQFFLQWTALETALLGPGNLTGKKKNPHNIFPKLTIEKLACPSWLATHGKHAIVRHSYGFQCDDLIPMIIN